VESYPKKGTPRNTIDGYRHHETVKTHSIDGLPKLKLDQISSRIEELTANNQQSEMETLITAFNTGSRATNVGTDRVIQHLRECAQRREYLDIYQMVAFRLHNRGHYTFSDYKAIGQAVLAMFTQTIGITVVLGEEILRAHGHDDPVCRKESPWTIKIMSLLFCMAILVLCYHHYIRFSHYGMYRVNAVDYRNKPDFINPYWIMLGRFVNVTVLLMVLWGAFSLIYYSVDPTEIVLNAMAMFFILELANLFVNDRDYQEMAEFLQTYKHVTDYDIAKGFKVMNQCLYYPLIIIVALSLVAGAVMSFLVAYCH